MGLGSAIRIGNEFPKGVPEAGAQGVTSIPYHQDDVRVDPSDHVRPTDPVTTEDGVVVILDAATCVRGCSEDGILHPLTGQLPGDNGWVEADDLDLISAGKGGRFAGPRLRVNTVIAVTIVSVLSLNLVDAS